MANIMYSNMWRTIHYSLTCGENITLILILIQFPPTNYCAEVVYIYIYIYNTLRIKHKEESSLNMNFIVNSHEATHGWEIIKNATIRGKDILSSPDFHKYTCKRKTGL